MSFLTPLFLLGGLAIALPVVFHLIRRSSREKIVFSSLMFLKPTPPRVTRRNRLEHIFLLLLRCLAICLLAAGFARPFLQKPLTPAAESGAGSQTVILLDTSASMRRAGVWDDALTKAEAALRRISPADNVAVFTFDDRVRSVVGFEQWTAMNVAERASLAARQLTAEKPTWRATHLGNALIAAAEALEDAGKREQRSGARRIVLITDLQEGSRLDGLQGYEWPRGIEVTVETVKARKPTNAGLQWVLNSEDSAGTGDEAAARLRVSNSSDAKREQFQIRWDPVAGAATLDAYVPPGQSRIVPAPKLPAGQTGGRLVLSGDDDDFDNSVFLVQPRPEEVNVIFLGDDSETDPAQSLFYVKRAFQNTGRQLVRIISLTRTDSSSMPRSVIPPPPASGSSAANGLAIISGSLPETRITAVRQFIGDGGTALFVMNDASASKTLGQLGGVSDLVAVEAPVSDYSMFGKLDFEHPLLAPFADPRFSDFTKIRVWKHRKLPLDKLSRTRVLARLDNDDPAIVEWPVGRGRLFVFTFSWRPSDSQLALSSKFVPLLYSLLDQAGGIKAQLAQYRVGETVDLSTLTNAAAALVIRKPDGSQVEISGRDTRFSQTDLPGIYEVVNSQPILRFAVNLDAAESRTAPLPIEELERLNLPVKSPALQPAPAAGRNRQLHDAELEGRQKLWRWLIVAAVVVLIVETWLAGWITRRSAARIEAAA